MPLDHNHVLLLRLLARDNPSLSMSNWKELCEANNLSVDTTKKRFAAMRKEFMDLGDDMAHEALAPRKRGRPPKNPKSDASDDAKPKTKRAKTASVNKAAAKSNGDECGDGDGSDASEAPATAAGKNPKKATAKKEDADASDVAPASDEDEA